MQLNQEGVSQVRKAAERVAKGHKGEEAVRKQETASRNLICERGCYLQGVA